MAVAPPRTDRTVHWDLNDLASTGDLAAEHNVRNSTISNWINRYDDFPQPLVTLAIGAVYSRRQVRQWYDGRDWLPGKHDKRT
jgi:hypothetical protein